MKRLFHILATFFIAAQFATAAPVPVQNPAADKATLGQELERFLHRSPYWASIRGQFELILRVEPAGTITLLDIDGQEDRMVTAMRLLLQDAHLIVDASLHGKAFRFQIDAAPTT